MTLTADQQAMLQLLLERGQSYADLASVLGVGVDEVRSRARAALTELGGADPDAEVGLTDYLLGQADPIGRADAVRHLQADPDSERLAAELAERLRGIAPDAQLPRAPRAEGASPHPQAGAERSLPPRRDTRAIRAGPAARHDVPSPAAGDHRAPRAPPVLVIAAVLAIAGAFDGGDEEPAPAAETTTSAEAEGEVLTSVPLEAQSGGDASGEAAFGVASGDQPYVDISLQRAEPTLTGPDLRRLAAAQRSPGLSAVTVGARRIGETSPSASRFRSSRSRSPAGRASWTSP